MSRLIYALFVAFQFEELNLYQCAICRYSRAYHSYLLSLSNLFSRNFEIFRARLYFTLLTIIWTCIAWLTIDKTQKNVFSTIRETSYISIIAVMRRFEKKSLTTKKGPDGSAVEVGPKRNEALEAIY